MSYETVDINNISDIGAKPDDGRYVARYLDYKAMKTKTDNHYPMVITTLEIMRGEFEGFEIGKISVLNVSKDKRGRTTAGGIMDLKRTFANIGKPLPQNFAFPLDEEACGKLIESKLKGLLLDITYKTDEKNPQYSRIQINGLAGGGTAAEDDEEFEEYPEYEEVAV